MNWTIFILLILQGLRTEKDQVVNNLPSKLSKYQLCGGDVNEGRGGGGLGRSIIHIPCILDA